MSEAVEPVQVAAPGNSKGTVGWLSWINNKSTNEDKKALVKSAGCTIPAWLCTSAGLTDVHQKLKGHILDKGVQLWAHNDEANGAAIPGTAITDEQYKDLPDDEKAVKKGPESWKIRRFVLVGVVDEKNDTITPAVFEQGSWGLVFTTGKAEENFSRAGLDARIPLPGLRTIFDATASLDKNKDTGFYQTNGQCRPTRVYADDANGARALRHCQDPQFLANIVACREAIAKKVNELLATD